MSDDYLADKEQQVSVTGEVHGEEEEGQLLNHRDAAFMGQCEGQRFDFWGFFGCWGLCVQRGAGPFSRPPQTYQVFKVLQEEGRIRIHCLYNILTSGGLHGKTASRFT